MQSDRLTDLSSQQQQRSDLDERDAISTIITPQGEDNDKEMVEDEKQEQEQDDHDRLKAGGHYSTNQQQLVQQHTTDDFNVEMTDESQANAKVLLVPLHPPSSPPH